MMGNRSKCWIKQEGISVEEGLKSTVGGGFLVPEWVV